MSVKNKLSFKKGKLGESGEDYLEAIFILEKKASPVRVKEIARFLGVSRPSVVEALQILKDKGLVKHEYYGGVELTAAGRLQGGLIYKRHIILERFLSEVLGVSTKVAAVDACRLEHSLSEETARRLLGFVKGKRKL